MRLFVALLAGVLFIALGCGTRAPATATNIVTISQLGAATANDPCFYYVGSDSRFHYFVTPDARQFRVRLAEWTMKSPFSHNGKFSLFMTVKDGKLTTPDAKIMSDLMQKGLVRPPPTMAPSP